MLCLSVWLSSITYWPAGSESRVPARPGQPVVRREQLVDLAGERDPAGDEHDQVVADPLEVGDQVRGQHDADPVLGDDLHQRLQELAPRERVEARDRLVQHQQLGPLRHRQRQRELGPLTAGQRAGPLPRVEPELARSGCGELARPSPG